MFYDDMTLPHGEGKSGRGISDMAWIDRANAGVFVQQSYLAFS